MDVMTALLVRRVDGRLVIELPETLASQVHLREGDMLEAIDLHSGGFSVNAMSSAKARQMRLGLAAMERFADTYAALAK